LAALRPTKPEFPPRCKSCIPVAPVATPNWPLAALLLFDPEPPCVELPLIPVVIPEPRPCGVAPDVLPSVVWPNAPCVELPRLACAKPAVGMASNANPTAMAVEEMRRFNMGCLSAGRHQDCRLSAEPSK
jgi:hypothetical protein